MSTWLGLKENKLYPRLMQNAQLFNCMLLIFPALYTPPVVTDIFLDKIPDSDTEITCNNVHVLCFFVDLFDRC